MQEGQLITYGQKFPATFNQIHIELSMWREYLRITNPQLERWQHLRRACLLLFSNLRPSAPGRDDGDWHLWLDRICRAYADYSYIAALGCSNSTKTHSFHMVGFVDYLSSPWNTQMICTTTSLQGLKERVWPILSKLYYQTQVAGWVISSNPSMIIKGNKEDTKHAIKAKAIERKADEGAMIDNLIGAHTDRVIWIQDEATSAPQGIDKAWDNLAGGTIHRRLIKLGNPDDQLDSLGNFCRPEAGWDSLTDDVEQWNFTKHNEKGVGLHFDGRKSPNLKYPVDIKTGKSRWSWMFGQPDIDRLSASKDQDPLGYYRFCVGWFADSSMVPKVMTMADLDAAKCRGLTTWYGQTSKFAALDPAYGGDRAILKFFKMGMCAESHRQVMEQYRTEEVPVPPQSIKGQAIGQYVIRRCREETCKIIGIDTTTDNSAPAEYIMLNSDIEVVKVDFGGAASDLPVSPTDKMLCSERYDRKVTEIWFTVRQILPQIRGLDADTCVELCSRYYRRMGKPEKLSVETKKEMKKRSLGKSPDLADALCIGVAVFRKQGGFDLPAATKSNDAWKKAAKRRGNIYSSQHSYATAI